MANEAREPGGERERDRKDKLINMETAKEMEND